MAWFIRAWDEKMCVEHDKAWGRIFAEQMQHLCEALAAGEASAVADFMASETQRALQDVLALRVWLRPSSAMAVWPGRSQF